MIESPDGSYDSAKRKKKTVRRPILSATVNHIWSESDLSTGLDFKPGILTKIFFATKHIYQYIEIEFEKTVLRK